MKCVVKLLIHPQTSAIQPLKFGKGLVISSQHYSGCDYLAILGLILIHVSIRDPWNHYNYVIISAMASQITSPTIVYSTVYSRRVSKKTSKLRVTGLCAGKSPVTGEFPAQRASNTENVSILMTSP